MYHFCNQKRQRFLKIFNEENQLFLKKQREKNHNNPNYHHRSTVAPDLRATANPSALVLSKH